MKEKKQLFPVANLRIDQLGAYQSTTDIQDAGTADNLAAEGKLGTDASNAASLVQAGDDLTITGLAGQATVDVAAGNTAKEIVNLVNDKIDSTGVSATATTTVKLEGLTSDAVGSHVVSLIFMEKNSTVKQYRPL